METRESLGYLKGLMEGLEVKDSKEAKIFGAIIDVLSNLTEDVDDMTEGLELLAEQVDDIDEDLADVEDYLDDEDDDDYDFQDDAIEVECPSCHESFVIDEDTAMEGKFECPNCGEHLEFDFDDDCDCDCDCGCED